MYFSVLGDESIYEAVDELLEKVRENNQFDGSVQDKPMKMSTLEMFGKTGSVLRALWSEMPEVRILIIHRVRGYGYDCLMSLTTLFQ